jgi:AraC-like DNA-binding protein
MPNVDGKCTNNNKKRRIFAAKLNQGKKMFGQLPLDIILLFMLYGAGTMMAVIACLYLLLRRSNVIAPDVTSPVRLRRWTAAFFAVLALGHLWYIPAAVLTSSEDVMLSMLIGALLDCMMVIPLAIIVMLCMLQDRRRPLWPVSLMVAPLIVGAVVCIVTRSDALIPILRLYFVPLGIGLAVYMMHAVRQYGHWLRDNYADLEHKEVWRSFVALAVIMLMFGFYVSGFEGMIYEYIIQVLCIGLIDYLLWRVETLSDLSISHPLSIHAEETTDITNVKDCEDYLLSVDEDLSSEGISAATYDQIESLLQQRCVDTQLYLEHDLTAVQLAQAIGSNRTYLGRYFARHDTTYNAYINDLRIDHFVRLYREAVAAQRPFTAQQLASQSGYRSYSTFSLAFKQRMGQSMTAWMRQMEG